MYTEDRHLNAWSVVIDLKFPFKLIREKFYLDIPDNLEGMEEIKCFNRENV